MSPFSATLPDPEALTAPLLAALRAEPPTLPLPWLHALSEATAFRGAGLPALSLTEQEVFHTHSEALKASGLRVTVSGNGEVSASGVDGEPVTLLTAREVAGYSRAQFGEWLRVLRSDLPEGASLLLGLPMPGDPARGLAEAAAVLPERRHAALVLWGRVFALLGVELSLDQWDYLVTWDAVDNALVGHLVCLRPLRVVVGEEDLEFGRFQTVEMWRRPVWTEASLRAVLVGAGWESLAVVPDCRHSGLVGVVG